MNEQQNDGQQEALLHGDLYEEYILDIQQRVRDMNEEAK